MKKLYRKCDFNKSLRQILYSPAQKHYSAHAGKSANTMHSGILAPMEGQEENNFFSFLSFLMTAEWTKVS